MGDIHINTKDCCGCGGCVAVCPINTIKMVADSKGFLQPVIDENACVHCGLCEKTCAFKNTQNSHDQSSTIKKAYAIRHVSDDVVFHSSSGGFFTCISDYVLQKGGVVYGAILDKSDMTVKHVAAYDNMERDNMRGSKYVQSDTTNVYQEVKKNITDGKIVLFSGTPCECAQLLSFLNGKRDNLILVDLFCHGVPSPLLFKEHISMWEKKKNSRAIDYSFRDKSYGYEHTHRITFENTSINKSIDLKRILKMYAYSMRESCYACPYASKKRIGDYSIADFWEVGKNVKVYDNKGMSTVLVNTKNAEKILLDILPYCDRREVRIDDIKQSALNKPVTRTEIVDEFWNYYFENGYIALLDKYGKSTFISKCYQTMIRIVHILHLDKLYIFCKSKIM